MDAIKCRAFLVAAQRGSFTAAAQELGYTQSGITRMINALEEELGFRVFARVRGGVQLTDNGHRILPLLENIVRACQQVEEYSGDICGLVRGTVSVGCYYSVSFMWMPQIIRKFQKRYPHIRVNMLERSNRDLAPLLASRRLDICVGARLSEVDYEWIPLYRDEMVAWLPQGHPLTRAKQLTPKMLEGENFIQPLPQQDTDLDRLLQGENLSMNLRYSTQEAFTAYNMVEAGLGVSLNQRLISQKWHGQVELASFSPPQYFEMGIAVPCLKEASPATRKLIECIRETVAELI